MPLYIYIYIASVCMCVCVCVCVRVRHRREHIYIHMILLSDSMVQKGLVDTKFKGTMIGIRPIHLFLPQ